MRRRTKPNLLHKSLQNISGTEIVSNMHNVTLNLLPHPLTKAYSWQLAAVGPEVRWNRINILRMMQMLLTD